MKIGNTIYVATRKEWRSWLSKHHDKEKEIWLIYYKKHSAKPRIPYNDAVEEALCYGWIDSNLKTLDKDRFVQRFTPRRLGSKISEMNKERIRRLIKQNKMTAAGLAVVQNVPDISLKKARAGSSRDPLFAIAPDILQALKADKQALSNFEKFPTSYKRIRIGWIEGARKRPKIFEQRLRYFLKMTAQNKRFGMVQ